MAEYGKISWEISPAKSLTMGKVAELEETLRKSFLQLFQTQFPNKEAIEYSKTFQAEYEKLHRAVHDAHAVFSKIPLVSTFLEWVQKAYARVDDAQLLLKNGFIGIKDVEGGTWTLHHASLHDPNEVFVAIRCRRELSLIQRERLVEAYGQFILYLSNRTKNFIKPPVDNELEFIKSRLVRPPEFCKFADQLSEKFQLIAKLLYFGDPAPTLDAILSLNISDVKFDDDSIWFDMPGIVFSYYPQHVFADIQAMIGKRSKGKLFLGRQNASLNPTTVFRNFKEAGIKANLGPDFSPAMLTKNK